MAMDAMATGPYDQNQGSRTVARVFALLALAVVAIVVVAVVAGSVDESKPGSTSSSSTTTSSPQSPAKDPYYVVKPGDTWSGIAAKEGVTTFHLTKLNRGRPIDPELLQPAQCVDIVPDGCKKLAGG